ncbi:MAG: DUF2194 domain-containing protein, partial [Oscillospiraceae bacterium]|nr:DUF2194 domain-containing protein [Oscillospiraceae bacterium]
TFYTNILWPDVLAWEKEYGIKHTGVIIEDYNDLVQAPLEQQDELARFIFFGNMLLKNGGELGFHGYNHMPLAYNNFDYQGLYDEYTHWKSETDMVAALTELQRFSSKVFKNETFTVYVPPSNILSEEGRAVLVKTYPQLRIIASTYYKDACSYEQEFGIDEDGIVRVPRIVSGCNIDDFQELMAFSELNFHYVQTHFLHPDDVLDPFRGGEIGWEQMEKNFHKYLDWITQAAPKLRQLTATGAGVAVEQYTKLNYTRTNTANTITLNIGGFGKQAYFMMRINDGRTVKSVDGGSTEHLTGNLYIVKAAASKVTIHLEA